MSTRTTSPAASPSDSPARRAVLADPERLTALTALKLDPDTVAGLQELVAEVGERLGMPIALCNLLLDDAQVFVATRGLEGTWLSDVGGTPSEWAFCTNVVERNAPFVVEDATQDPVLAVNPLVVHDNVRSYLGVPLTDGWGTVVGSMCTLDAVPRTFSGADLAVLRELATAAERLLRAHRDV